MTYGISIEAWEKYYRDHIDRVEPTDEEKYTMDNTMNRLAEVLVEYYKSGASTTQRFGQFYCNRYLPIGKSWPELFYERDLVKAQDMIFTYLNEEK